MAKNDTLCWDCKYATGNCPWSEKHKPIPGWNATKTKIISRSNYNKNGKSNIVSYSSFIVHECPLFEDNCFRKERLEFKEKYHLKTDSTFYGYVEQGLIDIKGNLLVPNLKQAIAKLNRTKREKEEVNGI